MALQATATMFGLTAVTAVAAVLCALVVLWWALVMTALATPVRWPLPCSQGQNGASTSRPTDRGRPTPTDSNLGIDRPGQTRTDWGRMGHVETGPTDSDLGIDFEALVAQMGHCCDKELNVLCESAMDSQSARVMQDLEDEFGGGPACARARHRPTSAEPRLGLEALRAESELHEDVANVELRCDGTARD